MRPSATSVCGLYMSQFACYWCKSPNADAEGAATRLCSARMLIVSVLPANGGANTNKWQRVVALSDAPLEDCQREYEALLAKLAPQAQAGGGVSSGGGRFIFYFIFIFLFFISFLFFFWP